MLLCIWWWFGGFGNGNCLMLLSLSVVICRIMFVSDVCRIFGFVKCGCLRKFCLEYSRMQMLLFRCL